MFELEIGDEVLVRNDENQELKFSRVLSFFERLDEVQADFIRLEYELENKVHKFLTITPRHLIFVSEQYASGFDYKPAFEVKIGYFFEYFNQDLNSTQIAKVVAAKYVKSIGVYAPLTEIGHLIVDDIHVSCFSMVKSHKITQFFFNLVKIFKTILYLPADVYLDISVVILEALKITKLSYLFLNVSF